MGARREQERPLTQDTVLGEWPGNTEAGTAWGAQGQSQVGEVSTRVTMLSCEDKHNLLPGLP
jgi:hypothetical protein